MSDMNLAYTLSLSADELTAIFDGASADTPGTRALKAKAARARDDLATRPGQVRVAVTLTPADLGVIARIQAAHRDLLRGAAVAATRLLIAIDEQAAIRRVPETPDPLVPDVAALTTTRRGVTRPIYPEIRRRLEAVRRVHDREPHPALGTDPEAMAAIAYVEDLLHHGDSKNIDAPAD